MKRRTIAALATAIGLAGAALLAGCGDDPQNRPVRPGPVPPGTFEDLTEKWHPLNNLEEAYKQRNIERYRECLDSDYYTFFFSSADYSSGKTPESWSYTEDTDAAERMLDPQLPDINIRAVAFEFDLVFDKNAIIWHDFTPTDPPNETWYTATFGYTYYLKLGDGVHEYIQAPGASAAITIRQNPDDGKWRIVRIYDVPGTAQTAAPARRVGVRSVEETSLGQIKALFTPEG